MAHAHVSGKSQSQPVAIVTGGSAGLGLVIAESLLREGYCVALLARDADRLSEAKCLLESAVPAAGERIMAVPADLSQKKEASRAIDQVAAQWGRIDVLINNVGQSDRGNMEQLSGERLLSVLSTNLLPTLYCSQHAYPYLVRTQGTIVNIGSLAAKVGARYLGAYPAAKHALAALTQQMRLEWRGFGVHVGLLNPGPIVRQDAGERYTAVVEQAGALPQQAKLPGGGTRVGGLPPQRVAKQVIRMIRGRKSDCLLPGYLRPLVAVGNLWPRLGDWLLLRFTSSKRSENG